MLKEIDITGNSYEFFNFIKHMIFNVFLSYCFNFISVSNNIINLLPIIVIPLSLEFLNEVLYDNHYYDMYIYKNYFYKDIKGGELK